MNLWCRTWLRRQGSSCWGEWCLQVSLPSALRDKKNKGPVCNIKKHLKERKHAGGKRHVDNVNQCIFFVCVSVLSCFFVSFLSSLSTLFLFFVCFLCTSWFILLPRFISHSCSVFLCCLVFTSSFILYSISGSCFTPRLPHTVWFSPWLVSPVFPSKNHPLILYCIDREFHTQRALVSQMEKIGSCSQSC